MTTAPAVEYVTLRFSPAQSAFWKATERYVDFEGAIRAGKTTPAILRVIGQAHDHPGMAWMMCRWTQDATDAQLKPRFRELCPPQILGPWVAGEDYYEILTGGEPSKIYIRGLKTSEEHSRYGKFAGLTLAGIYVDQPEEMPEDFWAALKGRLSQPGYPQQIYLTPNPPAEGHWLARDFPDSGPTRPDYRYIRTSVYDNRAALGEEYIKALEEAYPDGTVLRRRFIDGRRGLSAVGDPVYAGYWQRKLHEAETLVFNHELPLLEGWDFGHSHPCVIWAQFLPWGALHLLGGIMGEALFIEDFAPMVLQQRQAWFPGASMIQSTGDPAGSVASSQGTNRSASDVLRVNGINLQTQPNANHPNRRNTAIQAVAGYMRRLTATGPAFQVHPRFLVLSQKAQRFTSVLVDALEAGYVWDDKSVASSANPSTRRPKKDGFYDHCCNCLEYIMLAFGPSIMEKKAPAEEFPRFVDPYSMAQGWMAMILCGVSLVKMFC